MAQTCDLSRVPASGKVGPAYPVTWDQAQARCRPGQRIVVAVLNRSLAPRVITTAAEWEQWQTDAGSFFDTYYVESTYLGGRAGAGEEKKG